MTDDEITPRIEQKAIEIAVGGMTSKSTSVDGVQVSQTMMDPTKIIAAADALDKRAAAKRGILSQIKFVKIKDQP